MNEMPWPSYRQLGNINVNAKSDAEMRQVLATLQNLIQQFNELVVLGGGLQQQIISIIQELSGIYPDLGNDNLGYITNATLLDWPHDTFAIQKDIDNNLEDVLTITINTATPSAVLGPSAGPLEVRGGGVWLNSNKNTGISEVSGDLRLNAASGVAYAPVAFKANNYVAANGSIGQSYSSGDIVFRNGLYISGSFTPGDTGTVADCADDDTPYVRFHHDGDTDGHWEPLDAYLPDVVAATPWAGSTSLTTLGTIATGAWSTDATPIALDCIATIAANCILGNNTGSAAIPDELTTAEVLTMLGYGSVAGDITTTGDASFGTVAIQSANTKLIDFKNKSGTSIFWIDTVGDDENNPYIGNIYTSNRMFAPGFRALTDGNPAVNTATGIVFMSHDKIPMFSINTLTGDFWTTAKFNTQGTIETAGNGVFGGNITCGSTITSLSARIKDLLPYDQTTAGLYIANYANNAYLMRIDTATPGSEKFYIERPIISSSTISATTITATAVAVTNISNTGWASLSDVTADNITVTGALIIPMV